MIHQPHFLPWPGYIARCLAVDTFVVLDNVQFKRGHFQQRTKYLDQGGAERWLSLPVEKATKPRPISEIKIVTPFRLREWQRALIHAYKRFPLFEQLWPSISACIESSMPSLLAVNVETLHLLVELVASQQGVTPPKMVLASTVARSADRTGRLVEACERENITHLVLGRDAQLSHNLSQIRRAGVQVVEHRYCGPASTRPVSGVTVLDQLARLGLEEAAGNLVHDWSLHDSVED